MLEIGTVHRDLRRLFQEVVREYDCSILQGYRSPEEQLKLYAEGKSRVTQSKHNLNPATAIDVAPYPIQWDNTKRFYHFAGYVQGVAYELEIPIRWGGDWDRDYDLDDQDFLDLVHFELIDKP